MRRFLTRLAVTAAALCSITVPAIPAHADIIPGDCAGGILSGNRVTIPITVTDVAAALLGDATVIH